MRAKNWFAERALKNFEAEIKPRLSEKSVQYLEIGVWYGNSLVWMLENVLTGHWSRAYAVDPWLAMPGHPQEEIDRHYDTVLERCRPFGIRAKVIRCLSSVWLRHSRTRSHTFDMIYLDGDHSAIPFLDDLVLSWPLLKVGGILLIDDYLVRSWIRDGVKSATDAVMKGVYAPYISEILRDQFQVGYLKTGDVELFATKPDGSRYFGVQVR